MSTIAPCESFGDVISRDITACCYMPYDWGIPNNIGLAFGLSSKITTPSELRTWLTNNHVTVQYILREPEFEPFEDQTLPYISTYDGVTSISNDATLSAEMTVKYPTTDASAVGSRNASRIDDVTANLNRLLVYSTREKIVGTWIDGKPIYRKVFKFNLGETTKNLATELDICHIEDILAIIDVKGYVNWQYGENRGTVSIPHTKLF